LAIVPSSMTGNHDLGRFWFCHNQPTTVLASQSCPTTIPTILTEKKPLE
jgi:hypothetical protein